MAPDISVLMPSYNYGRFLRDAIESVLRQEGPEIELIVQDGESTDDTTSILESYGSRVDWVSVPDTNQSDALNKALDRASGEWVTWLNVDEFYLPGSLGSLLRAARRLGSDIVYGDAVFVDAEARFLRLLPQHRFSKQVLEHYGTYISTCALMFRRDIVEAEPWDTAMGRCMDWDLFLQLERKGRRFDHEPVPVGAFRIHDEQITAGSRSAAFPEHRRLRRKHGIEATRPRKVSGYLAHASLKLQAGSYFRQWRARKLRGADLRWFEDPAGVELLYSCYGMQARD